MKKFIYFLKEHPFTLLASLTSVIGFLLAVFVQIQQSNIETKVIQVKSEYQIRKTQKVVSDIEERLSIIETKLPIPDNIIEQSALSAKIKDVEARIAQVQESTLALRQAVNPLKPEEVLTIARLTDAVVDLNKKFSEFQETIRKDQDSFEKSMLRETKASNQSTNLILVVLIPLVLNFLYTVWKDLKEGKKEQP